jgi:hypothetical protein
VSDEQTKSEPKEPKAAEAAADEPTYHRDRLVEQAYEFCGVTPSVMVGALSAQKGNKTNFTLAEAKDAVQKWLRRPAGTSKPVEEG